MEKHKHQRGQALAEYMPTFAGFFALSILALWGLGSNLRDLYQAMVDDVIQASYGEVADEVWDDSEDDLCMTWESLPGGSQCSASDSCELEEYDDQVAGTFLGNHEIETLVIKAGTDFIMLPGAGTYFIEDCMVVSIQGKVATFLMDEDSDPDCKFISHIQSWSKKVCVDPS